MTQALKTPAGAGKAPAGEQQGIRPAEGYAGDVLPELAHAWMTNGEAVVVDVRSDAEREWVGYVPGAIGLAWNCLLYTSPSPRDGLLSRMPSSA